MVCFQEAEGRGGERGRDDRGDIAGQLGREGMVERGIGGTAKGTSISPRSQSLPSTDTVRIVSMDTSMVECWTTLRMYISNPAHIAP
jgi:hypothetical protein